MGGAWRRGGEGGHGNLGCEEVFDGEEAGFETANVAEVRKLVR